MSEPIFDKWNSFVDIDMPLGKMVKKGVFLYA